MADWADIKHAAGDTDYIAHLNTHVDRTQALATEIENARSGDASLLDRLEMIQDAIAAEITDLDAVTVKVSGLTDNLSAGGHLISNLQDPQTDQDAATKAYVNAVATAGGSPSAIPITSLGGGTLTALQLPQRNAAGSAWQGLTFPAQASNGGKVLGTDGTTLSWVVALTAADQDKLARFSIGKMYFFATA